MAEDGQVPSVSAAFPAPPPFYKSFTKESIERLQQLQSSTGDAFNPLDPVEALIPDVTALPSEIRSLIPPPLPQGGKYYSFSTLNDVDHLDRAKLSHVAKLHYRSTLRSLRPSQQQYSHSCST